MPRFLSLVLFACLIAQGAPLHVAVNDLAPIGVSPNDAEILGDRLRTELLATGAFRVMERGQMDQILKEQAFQKTGSCDQSECAVEIGKLLSVDRMIVGSVGKIGEIYTVQARILDVQTGEIVSSANQDYEGKIEGLLSQSIPELARRLASGVGSPVSTAISPKPVSTPKSVVSDSSKSVVGSGGVRASGSRKSSPRATGANSDPKKTWLRWGCFAGASVTGLTAIYWHREAVDQRAKAAKAASDYAAGTIGLVAYKAADNRAVDRENSATTKSVVYGGLSGLLATAFALTFAF